MEKNKDQGPIFCRSRKPGFAKTVCSVQNVPKIKYSGLKVSRI